MEIISASLLFCLLVLGIGGIFLVIGVCLLLFWNNRKSCEFLVNGTVTKMEQIIRGSLRGNWQAQFCYTYKDKDYKVVSPYSTSSKRYNVGDDVKIYIDENHPEVFWIPSEAKNKKIAGIVLIGIGSFAVLSAILLFIVLSFMAV